MAKKRSDGKTTLTHRVIFVLILVIFAVALVIGASRIMEWNELLRREKELEESRDELIEEGQSTEN